MNDNNSMEEEIAKLKNLLRSLAEEEQTQASKHFTVEQLASYHFKRLSVEEAEQIQDHLAMCQECASLLLDLAEFCASEDAESALFSANSQPPLHIRPPASPSLSQRFREWIFPVRYIYALAASALALSLSLAVWIALLSQRNKELVVRMAQEKNSRQTEATKEFAEAQRQKDEALARAEQLRADLERSRREIAELIKPQLNVPIVDLPLGETRAQGATRPLIELRPSDTRFTLIIPAPAIESKYSDYTIEILDQSGAPVVNEKGLRLDPESGFRIALASQAFPIGEYRFNLYGLGRKGKTLILSDLVRIRYKQRE